MKNKSLKRALLATIFSLACSPATYADSGDIGVAVKGSTLGLGGEVTVGISPSINARAGCSGFHYNGHTTQSDIKYNYKLDLESFPVLLDWYPFDSGFRLSSGVVINNNNVTATGTSQTSYNIGGTPYSPAELGSLSGKVGFKHVAPYAGIGWGNAVGEDSGLSITVDLGIMFQGRPDVSLTAEGGTLVNTTPFKTNLANEINDVKNKINDLKYYPVISLGLAYKF